MDTVKNTANCVGDEIRGASKEANNNVDKYRNADRIAR
jgi:hypothetical protein